jgi:mannitol-1-phosphate 5-dehydrogenase
MAEPEIAAAVRGAMAEGSAAVARHHDLSPDEQELYIADLLRRFANPLLNDTIARVGRDPVRKLRSDDRLVGAGLLAIEQGVEPVEIARAIAAALRFDPPADAAAVTLQTELRTQGLTSVLSARCGLASDHPLAVRVAAELRVRG